MRDNQEPVTQIVDRDEVRATIDAMLGFVSSARDRRIVINRDGKPIAALISFHDLERFDLFVKRREKDFEILDRFSAAFADVPEDELQREIDRAVAEARAELRAKRALEAAVPT